MKWLLAMLALVCALLGGWWFLADSRDQEALQPVAGLEPEGAAFEPGVLPDARGAFARQASRSNRGDDAADDAGAAVTNEERNGSKDGETVLFLASVQDAQGLSIQAGELTLPFQAEHGQSSIDSTGSFLLEVPHASLGNSPLKFQIDAQGYASVVVQRTWKGEEQHHLGVIQLERGSRVTGQVIDTAGRGVAHALVCAAEMGKEIDGEYQRSRGLYGPRRGLSSVRSSTGRGTPVALSPEVIADANGRFTIDAIPGSWTRLWARSDESRWTWSENLAIHHERPVHDVELRIPDASAEDWIQGVALDPQGNPVPFQRLRCGIAGEEGWNTSKADGAGRFKVPLEDPAPRDLTAHPDVWEWDTAKAFNVVPGTHNVVLQFQESEWLWVRAKNADGEPVTRGSVMGRRKNLEDNRKGDRLPRVISDLWDDGRARLHVPDEDFYVEVTADGYEDGLAGPFPQGTSHLIEVVLEKLHGLQVRVTYGGKPVPGAHIRAQSVAPEGKEYTTNWQGEGEGFGQDLSGVRRDTSVTDPLGRAILRLRGNRALNWHLVAEAEGHATGYSTVVTHEDVVQQRKLEIALPLAGSLRGKVELPAEVSGQGWFVVACDGLGMDREAKLDESGNFHFPHLHPGPWQVRAFRPGQRFYRTNMLRNRTTRTIDVQIHAGQQAELTFSPPPRGEARLRGQLTIDGHELGAWRGSVQGSQHQFECDEEGRFDVAGLEPGEAVLRFSSTDPRWSHLNISVQILLTEGDNWSEQELTLGTLEITLPVPAEGENPAGVLVQAQGDEFKLSFYKRSDPSGQIAPLLLPVGSYTVRSLERVFSGRQRSESPSTLFEVRAGETVKVALSP